MKHGRTILALRLLCALLLLFFLAAAIPCLHDCHGGDCRVCEIAELIGDAAVLLMMISAVPLIIRACSMAAPRAASHWAKMSVSLVDLHILLLD